MTDLTTKTPAELQSMTKAQIIAAILEGQTDTELEDSEDGPHGQVRRIYAVRDRATGAVLRRERTDWTYHPDGSVATITTVRRDGAGRQTARRTVRHRTDGSVTAES